MSDEQWELLTTAEAVVEAGESGRKVQFTPGGSHSADEMWRDITPAVFGGVKFVAIDLSRGARYRALIKPAQPAADIDRAVGEAFQSAAPAFDSAMRDAITSPFGLGIVRASPEGFEHVPAADVVPAIPPGYKPWGGGKCPEEVAQAHDAETHVILRDGSHLISMVGRGHWFNWRGFGDRTIIAYRVEEPARAVATADEVVIESHWLQTIMCASLLLEQSSSAEDNREGAALRKLIASARAVAPKADAPAESAFRTLEALGYTYHGGERWKPPLGKPPRYVTDDAPAEPAEVEALAAKVGVYHADGVVMYGEPLYAFTPAELGEFARRLRPVVVDEAMKERAASALRENWNLHGADSRRMAHDALTAALSPEGRSDG